MPVTIWLACMLPELLAYYYMYLHTSFMLALGVFIFTRAITLIEKALGKPSWYERSWTDRRAPMGAFVQSIPVSIVFGAWMESFIAGIILFVLQLAVIYDTQYKRYRSY